MGLFKRRKKDVIDLTKTYEKEKEKIMSSAGQKLPESNASASQPQSSFGFFGNFSSPSSVSPSASSGSAQTSSQEYIDISGTADDKRKKLAKRLMDMTQKIEDLSNQIYHLQQRVEVLEKKGGKTI
jgi:hypothetical protein